MNQAQADSLNTDLAIGLYVYLVCQLIPNDYYISIKTVFKAALTVKCGFRYWYIYLQFIAVFIREKFNSNVFNGNNQLLNF